MTDREREELIAIMKQKADLYATNGKEARAFLVRIGVIDETGELTENYKNLSFHNEL